MPSNTNTNTPSHINLVFQDSLSHCPKTRALCNTKNGLTNSEGCIKKGPIGIQRDDPPTVVLIPGSGNVVTQIKLKNNSTPQWA